MDINKYDQCRWESEDEKIKKERQSQAEEFFDIVLVNWQHFPPQEVYNHCARNEYIRMLWNHRAMIQRMLGKEDVLYLGHSQN